MSTVCLHVVSLNRGGFKFVQFVTPGSDFTHVLVLFENPFFNQIFLVELVSSPFKYW